MSTAKMQILHCVVVATAVALAASTQELEIVRTPYVTLEVPRNLTKSERKGGGLDFITGPPTATLGFMIEVVALTEFKERTWKTTPEYLASLHVPYSPYNIRGREWGMWINEYRGPFGIATLTQKNFFYVGKSRMYLVNYRYQPPYQEFDATFKRMLVSIEIIE